MTVFIWCFMRWLILTSIHFAIDRFLLSAWKGNRMTWKSKKRNKKSWLWKCFLPLGVCYQRRKKIGWHEKTKKETRKTDYENASEGDHREGNGRRSDNSSGYIWQRNFVFFCCRWIYWGFSALQVRLYK